jgi:hypothetical protein
MSIKTLSLALFAASISSASFAGCDGCGPYNFELKDDNALAVESLTKTLEDSGFHGAAEFSFQWDGQEVLYSIEFTPKPILSVGDVNLYDKLGQHYTGYIAASDLGAPVVESCLNNYSFQLTGGRNIYRAPTLKSMKTITDKDEITECSGKMDFTAFFNQQNQFIKRTFGK